MARGYWTCQRTQDGIRCRAVNPNRKANVDTRTPDELLDLIEAKGREIAEALSALRQSRPTKKVAI